MRGVVLQTYGAGNGPAARKDLMDALKEASDRGVIIINCTQCSIGGVSALYSVGKVYLSHCNFLSKVPLFLYHISFSTKVFE